MPAGAGYPEAPTRVVHTGQPRQRPSAPVRQAQQVNAARPQQMNGPIPPRPRVASGDLARAQHSAANGAVRQVMSVPPLRTGHREPGPSGIRRVSDGRLVAGYALSAIAVLAAAWCGLSGRYGGLFTLTVVILGLICGALAGVFVAETASVRRWSLVANGGGFLLMLVGTSVGYLWAEVFFVVATSVFGAGWALARSRDPRRVGIAWGIAGFLALVLVLINGVGVSLIVGPGIITWPSIVGALAPVGVAWAAAGLSPRSELDFAAHAFAGAPVAVPRGAPIGYTDDGRPVYGNVPSPAPSPGPNGLAIASLVCGFTALSIVAIILGHMSRGQSRREGQASSGLALAGLILGYITLAVQVTFGIWYVLILVRVMALT